MLQWQLKVGVEDLVDSFPSLSFFPSFASSSAAKKPNACQETHKMLYLQGDKELWSPCQSDLIIFWKRYTVFIEWFYLRSPTKDHTSLPATRWFWHASSLRRSGKRIVCLLAAQTKKWSALASSRLNIHMWRTPQITLWFEIFVVDRKVAEDLEDLGAIHKLHPPK